MQFRSLSAQLDSCPHSFDRAVMSSCDCAQMMRGGPKEQFPVPSGPLPGAWGIAQAVTPAGNLKARCAPGRQ